MFMSSETQCRKEFNSPQLDIHIQYNSSENSSKIFCKKRRDHIKILEKGKGTRLAKTILRKKNKVRRISLPNLKTYYIATVIKIVQYQWGDRHIDQQSRRGNAGKRATQTCPNDF